MNPSKQLKWSRFARRGLLGAASGALLTAAGLATAVTLEGCSSDADSTGGKRVVLRTRVTAASGVRETFTSSEGWDITLTRAAVAAGPFYYFDGTPPISRVEPEVDWRFAARVLGLGPAHAHPGHYQQGNALGQMLEASSVDLLGDAVDFPDGNGVTGIYRSGRFTFASATGSAEDLLEGRSVLLEGKAEKVDAEPRYFRATADLAALEKRVSEGGVDGCVFREADVQESGTITVTVDPKIWLDFCDFSEAEPGSAEKPAALPDSLRVELEVGLTQLTAYHFAYSTP